MKNLRLLVMSWTIIGIFALELMSCRPAAPTAPGSAPAATSLPEPAAAIQKDLVIYSGRTEGLVKPVLEQFSQATGIKTQVRYGGTSEMAATILEEGRNSPADIFYAQDPGGLGAVEHLLGRLPDGVLNKVAPGLRSPEGKWVGISGRARVVVYNTQKLKESDLPDDIWGFTEPKWKGRLGWAPTNASFQAMVTAMKILWGEDKTRQWLLGLQANSARSYSNNTAIVNAVGAGEVEAGFVNHYYLLGITQEKGEAFPARNYHPRGGGPGAIILVSGAGILETSKNKQAAERFLDFMLSKVAQQYFTSQTFEYPVISGIKTHPLLVPLEKIDSPKVGMAAMSDLKGTLSLLRDTGVLP